mmetsp:Transcript_17882/g.35948  ORF Transcript_17882/g.35948 Transcript_17882/m.35948 type:complete len:131 (+) Transcript_17882:136-528(+)
MIRLLTTTITLLLFLRASTESPDARSIQILNESGRRVDVSWIHPQTEELVLQSTPDVLAGASFSLNSFVSHSFLVREMPGKKTGECEGSEGECRVDYFSVNENHDQGEFYSLVVCLCLCVLPIRHCYIDE